MIDPEYEIRKRDRALHERDLEIQNIRNDLKDQKALETKLSEANKKIKALMSAIDLLRIESLFITKGEDQAFFEAQVKHKKDDK